MAEYIEREKLINELQHLPEQGGLSYLGIYDCVNTMPTADVQDVKHGKWLICGMFDDFAKCSCCSYQDVYSHVISENWRYCPGCGARMDGENNG